jgi:hypothetical protein
MLLRVPRLQESAARRNCRADSVFREESRGFAAAGGLFLPTLLRLCYNLRAVERSPHANANRGALGPDAGLPEQAEEHPISFCPVCSERLEPKRCKLVCEKCGYYLSCSDYY